MVEPARRAPLEPPPADDEGVALLAGMVLALPTPLRAGRSYAITSTHEPPGGFDDLPMYWSVWGARMLREDDDAELALRLFDYHTQGMQIENDFVATAVTGSITIPARYDEVLEMTLDLTATDDAGEQVRLHGDLSVRGERYTPPG